MHTSVDAGLCPTCQTPLIDSEPACRVCGNRFQTGSPGFSNKVDLRRRVTFVMLLLTLSGVGLCVYSNVQLVQSDVYKNSLQRAFTTPEVQAALGSGPRAKYPALGHLMHFGESKFAEWSVPVAGSRGSGHLYGVANEIDGEWDFSRFTFESENGKNRLNLTPIRPLNLPQVPSQRVYLVPISLAGCGKTTARPKRLSMLGDS